MAMEIITSPANDGTNVADEHEEADGQIVAAGMVNSRFAKEGEERLALDVQVQRTDTQQIIHIELDLELDDKTDKSGRVFCPFESTCKTLKGLGYQFGDDLSQIDTLVGANAHVTNTVTWKNGRRYDNWRFSRTTSYIDGDEAKNRFRSLMEQYRAKRAGVGNIQTQAAAPVQQQAAPAQKSRPNPFG